MKALRNLLLATLLAACGHADTDEQVREAAERFANAYFNYDFKTALSLCTPESERWLRFSASNVTEADLEALRAMESGAEVATADVESLGTDAATVSVTVDNFLQRDTIGRPGHVENGQTFRLNLSLRQGKWLVSLNGLPRTRE